MDGSGSWFGLPLAASPWPVQLAAIFLIAGFGTWLVMHLIIWQGRSVGLSFREDYWPEIRKSPMAVVTYRLGIYAVIGGVVAYLLGRFA